MPCMCNEPDERCECCQHWHIAQHYPSHGHCTNTRDNPKQRCTHRLDWCAGYAKTGTKSEPESKP